MFTKDDEAELRAIWARLDRRTIKALVRLVKAMEALSVCHESSTKRN